MMRLKGKKVAVLAADNYQEMELWVPYYRLKEEGAEVLVVGSKAGEVYKSKNGYPVKSDVAAAGVSSAEVDGVVIPGGYAPDLMRRDPAMVQLVRDLNAAGKLVAAICHAGWMLCSAGVLKGRTATGFFSIKDDMVNAGCNFVDQEVVVDENLVTARVPADLPPFCREVVNRLAAQAGRANAAAD